MCPPWRFSNSLPSILIFIHLQKVKNESHLNISIQFNRKKKKYFALYTASHGKKAKPIYCPDFLNMFNATILSLMKSHSQLPNSVEHLSYYLKKKKNLPGSFSNNNLKLYPETEIDLNESKCQRNDHKSLNSLHTEHKQCSTKM